MSNDSTFHPLDYYKKLTNCLAGRKQCKVDLNKIPGKTNPSLDSRNKLVTNKQIQDQFYAKYSNYGTEKKESSSELTKNNIGFNLKQKNNDDRKKNDSSYMKLPSNFFQANDVPSLSIFKVPARPKLQKSKLLQSSATVTKCSTLNTLFSVNFNPQKASTPLENNCEQAIISDPQEILLELNNGEGNAERKILENEECASNSKSTLCHDFLKHVDLIARNMDDKLFNNDIHVPDPIANIIESIQQHFDFTLQPLKNMNMDTCDNTEEPVCSLPVPKFYEPQNGAAEESVFNYTPSVMAATPGAFHFDATISTPNLLSKSFADSPNMFFNLETTEVSPFIMDQPNETTVNDLCWRDNEILANEEKWNNTLGVFRSPPNCSKLQKKFSQAFNDDTPEFSNNFSIRELNDSHKIFDNTCDFMQ